MRRILGLSLALLFWLPLLASAQSPAYTLTDGSAVSGEPVSYNESGLVLRDDAGKYLPRIAWGRFSQESLKDLTKNPKIAPLVEPFIELTPEQIAKRTTIPVKEVPRVPRPPKNAHFSAVFGTSLGFFILVILYLANLYAAFEVALFRARPIGMVVGIAAVAPVVAPIVFLSLPTVMPSKEPPPEELPAEPAPEELPEAELPTGMAELGPDQTPDLALGEVVPQAPALPETIAFTRGQFTFNRRFFETRLAAFIPLVPKEEDKDLVLFVSSARGDHVATRIMKLTPTEVHLLVKKGRASLEVSVPFMEIKEIQVKHKDAP